MSDKISNSDGTQAIRRAAAILKHIARSPDKGATLRDVSEAMELSRSTSHRILKCLVSEGFVAQSADARHYTIGGLTAELGLAAKDWQKATLQWRGTIERLSRDTGVTMYLMGRSGNESVCLDKVEGSAVVRVIPVEVGQRRPLGVGAGASAMLASMSDSDCESTIAAIEPYLERFPLTNVSAIRDVVRQTKLTGIAESGGLVVDGVYGLGVAIPARSGPSVLALSLAAHKSVATEERVVKWKQLMLDAVHDVQV